MKRVRTLAWLAPLLLTAGASLSRASTVLQADFSTYSNGDLNGQNGWAQFGAASTLPIQVAGGQVVVPVLPVNSGDNQDVSHAFGPVMSVGGTSLYAGAAITVNGTLASNSSTSGTSFLLALLTTDSPTPFGNLRLVTRQGTAPNTF